jgi:hypothetical protein
MCISLPLVLIAALSVEPPTPLQPLGQFDPQAIPESSGIVRSPRHRDVFWVHDDSGNPPVLHAVRRDGTIVRDFRLAVPNIDWEDIAVDARGRLYVGDIGNNGAALPLRVIYRLDEPDLEKSAAEPLRVSAASFYRFAEKARFDAEGLVVDAHSGQAILVSKRLDGREAELYAVPVDPPAPLLRPATPRRLGLLNGFKEPATGASLSDDGKLLAVCSEAVTRVYRWAPGPSWSLLAEVRYPPGPYEGIAWDGMDLVLVSEGRGIDRLGEMAWRRGTIRPSAVPPRPGNE